MTSLSSVDNLLRSELLLALALSVATDGSTVMALDAYNHGTGTCGVADAVRSGVCFKGFNSQEI